MSSWIEKAKGELEKHEVALEIIEGIAKLVKDALVKPDSNAHAVLKAIETAVETLIRGFDGKPITRAEVEKAITAMASRRAAMHSDIDAKLDAKFEDGGTD